VLSIKAARVSGSSQSARLIWRAHPQRRISAVASLRQPLSPTPLASMCAFAVSGSGSHLRRGMLPWQGGGHRRRFVRRKEPLKTWDLRRIFFAARLSAGERLETRFAALTAARSEPLKQVTISLRPGPYSVRGGQWRETFEFHRVEESNDSVGGGAGE